MSHPTGGAMKAFLGVSGVVLLATACEPRPGAEAAGRAAGGAGQDAATDAPRQDGVVAYQSQTHGALQVMSVSTGAENVGQAEVVAGRRTVLTH